jgi:hypothetical protein
VSKSIEPHHGAPIEHANVALPVLEADISDLNIEIRPSHLEDPGYASCPPPLRGRLTLERATLTRLDKSYRPDLHSDPPPCVDAYVRFISSLQLHHELREASRTFAALRV